MATRRREVLKHRQLTKEEVHAIKSCWAGEANKDQQRKALNLVLTVFAQIKQTPYQPGEPDETSFLSGRFFVGQSLMDVIEKPFNMLIKPEVKPSDKKP